MSYIFILNTDVFSSSNYFQIAMSIISKGKGFHEISITQRNKIELFVSCIHFDYCSWVN